MRDKSSKRWNTYEPYYVTLGDKRVADIFITHHARLRWKDRVEHAKTGYRSISRFLWERLKNNRIEPYDRNERDLYVIDNDLVMVAEFSAMEDLRDVAGNPLHRMIVVTFLGRMSETLELRDIRSYYAWLRHNRRMTLLKSGRKRK
jgi:hypothetical protein